MVWKVAFKISDNSIQASSSYAGPSVVGEKLKRGESCFCRNGELLCIKWCDKHQVIVLTTIDDAIKVAWKHDHLGNMQLKPKAFVEYRSNMQGCDLSDKLMTSYCMLCRSVKWWRKLFFHMLSLLLNNTYVLHKKFGVKPLAHDAFLEHIVQYLLNELLGNATKVMRKRPTEMSTNCRFEGHHYPVHVPKLEAKNVHHATLVRKSCLHMTLLYH